MDERPRQRFDPDGAGAVLTATMGTSAGLGALVGFARVGAAVGIPAGAFAVYRRYRGYFSG